MVDFLNRTDTDPFDTPIFRYYKLREAFLKQYRSRKIWGKEPSKQRILALNGLLEYIKETKKLGETHSEIKDEVVYDNLHLFIRRESNVLPNFPMKLWMKLTKKLDDVKGHEEMLATIVEQLEKQKEKQIKCFEVDE